MFSREPFHYISTLSLWAVLGVLISGCSSMSPSDSPISSPTSVDSETKNGYPSPEIIDPPNNKTVPSLPYLPPVDTQTTDWPPISEDESFERGNVFIDQTQMLVLESYPPQFVLQIRGYLPTPCHKLRVNIAEPDAQNRILVDIYSIVNPKLLCMQMLQEFDESVTIPNPPAGDVFSLWVNGQLVDEIKW